MIVLRMISLGFCGLLFICVCCLCCITLVSGNLRSMEYMDKIPGVTNFIASKSRAFDETKDEKDAECPICLVPFSDDPTQLIAELNCSSKHKFHKDCLMKWVETNDICPLCREKIPELKN